MPSLICEVEIVCDAAGGLVLVLHFELNSSQTKDPNAFGVVHATYFPSKLALVDQYPKQSFLLLDSGIISHFTSIDYCMHYSFP